MVILVDMDGTIVDFEDGFLKKWKTLFPGEICIQPEDRITPKIKDQYPAGLRDAVKSVYSSPDFFLELQPVKGSVSALKEMSGNGNKVYVCTKPIRNFKYCVTEKYEWVKYHLGGEWIERLVLTRDKTLIKGDILIDDWYTGDGIYQPEWEYVVFDRPYNKNISAKKRINWDNWQSVLFNNN